MPVEIHIDTLPIRPMLKRLFAGRATAGAALGLVVAMSMPCMTQAQEQQYPPPPPQGQYQYPPQAQGQYAYPPPGQYQYPPPPQEQYPYPPPAYAEPVAPPGAVWVGDPGECLYAAGAVYWCAPGVVFGGFPAGWDFGRYPVVSFAPGIVVDPIWIGGWRRSHPGFVFRGRLGTDVERRAFVEHRQEIIRNGARRNENPQRGERRPEER
jgi:hypothetical protein